MATKKSRPESLLLEDLGNLEDASDGELLALRERLIADVDRIHGQNRELAERTKALNEQKQSLQQGLAARAKALRAVKHQLNQRRLSSTPDVPPPLPVRHAKRSGPTAVR